MNFEGSWESEANTGGIDDFVDGVWTYETGGKLARSGMNGNIARGEPDLLPRMIGGSLHPVTVS